MHFAFITLVFTSFLAGVFGGACDEQSSQVKKLENLMSPAAVSSACFQFLGYGGGGRGRVTVTSTRTSTVATITRGTTTRTITVGYFVMRQMGWTHYFRSFLTSSLGSEQSLRRAQQRLQ